MAFDYDVRARLVLDGRRASGAFDQANRKAGMLENRLHSARGAAGGLWGKLLAIGGTYVGLNAVGSAVGRLTRGAVGYTAALEKTQIGLTSVIQAVEGTNWEAASSRAELAFDKIKEASLRSPATPQEMFGVFQGIIGPIEKAGFSMQKVLDITSKTVLASNALNVDLDQAQRDISLMTRGAAGMDVKLFSLLRSTGAIAETTQEWNQNLTAQERVTKLEAALSKFSGSAVRFGKSWGGVTSTFKGIAQELSRAGFQPILDTMASRLDDFNTYLLDNREAIAGTFEAMGTWAASSLSRVFSSAQQGFEWTISNWGRILGRLDSITSAFRKFAPLAAAYAVAPAVGNAVAGAAGGLSRVAGAAGGGAGVGAEAAGATAGLGSLAIALAAVAGAAMFVWENLEIFRGIWTNATEGMGGELMQLWRVIQKAFLPVIKIVGAYVALGLVPIFQGLMFTIRLLVKALTWALDKAGDFTNWAWSELGPMFDWMLERFRWLGEALRSLGQTIGLEVGRIRSLASEPAPMPIQDWLDGKSANNNRFLGLGADFDPAKLRQEAELTRTVPGGRSATTINNNMQGSRFVIKQDFKGKHDPDRVVAVMMEDLMRQAESRVSSGYAGALTR